MAHLRRKQEPMTPQPEPNDEIVSRIEAWLPGFDAPLAWLQTETIEFPTPDEPESTELRRSA
jgi:hypothetical protein